MSEIDRLDLGVVPKRFWPAITRVQQLSALDHHCAAYVFGSVARGDTTTASDLDVHVIVDQERCCAMVNHPIINGIKLDLTFLSFAQLAARTDHEIKRAHRVPMVAESTIVFDKTGELTHLRASAQHACPKSCTATEHQAIQFGIFHANDKAERLLVTDPLGALMVMHTSLNDLLNTHYQIQSRWRISDKRMLIDLRVWDPQLADLVERFVITADVQTKFAIWTDLIDYILLPLGGRQPIAENNCRCPVCQRDLALFVNA